VGCANDDQRSSVALLGLRTSAVITCCSRALVIYQGTGVVNFVQASFVIAGGYAHFDLRSRESALQRRPC
jgi:hypothetical protein